MKSLWILGLTALTLSSVACDSGNSSEGKAAQVEFLSTPAMQKMDLPFSDAVRAGNLLFLSGKIGNKSGSMELAEGGIEGETRQAMEHIRDSLERYGASLEQVVKCTVFLADMGEWGAMNGVYKTFFPKNKPARSALGVNGLALDARVEIECIAAIGHL